MDSYRSICIFFVISLERIDWVDNFEFLIKNVKLIRDLNKEVSYEIKVFVTNGNLSKKQVNIFSELNISQIVLADDKKLEVSKITHPSLQHGTILNILLDMYKEIYDYYIIMDPDFYVVQLNWLISCQNFMELENLDLLGAGYPYWMAHYRNDYPTAYFMVIRKGLVSQKLDFSPDLERIDMDDKDFRSQLKDTFQFSRFDLLISRYILSKVKDSMNLDILPTFVKLAMKFRMYFYRKFPSSYIRDTGYKFGSLVNKGKFNSFTLTSLAPLYFEEKVVFGIQPRFYLHSNPDVLKSGIDPLIHFWKYGILEKRQFQIMDRDIELKSLFYKIISKLFSFPSRNPYISFWGASFDKRLDLALTEEEKYAISFWSLSDSIFAFHLGNRIATNWSVDPRRLDSLMKTLLLERRSS